MWEVCRICAQICDSLVPIFQKEGGRPNLDEKIKKCLSLIITENDDKPKQICFACESKLEDFNDFFDLCQASNYKFECLLYSETANLQAHQAAEDPGSVILMRQSWDANKPSASAISENLNHQSALMQQSDSVIVVSKLEEQQNIPQECQDILLMVQLKYNKDQSVADKQSAGSVKQQTVLRHSDEYNKVQKCSGAGDVPSALPLCPVPALPSPAPPKSKKPFPCTFCDKSFMRRSSLNAHTSNHTNNKPFACNLCDKTFAIRWDLTVHQRLHTGVFMCEFCKKVFSVKGKLERHRRVHTGEKPFACEVKGCGKSFADKRNLDSHKDSHTDARPFACKLCDKRFKNKAHLADHQRVHSLETLFSCETCGKCFKWKANLKIHVKNGSCATATKSKIGDRGLGVS